MKKQILLVLSTLFFIFSCSTENELKPNLQKPQENVSVLSQAALSFAKSLNEGHPTRSAHSGQLAVKSILKLDTKSGIMTRSVDQNDSLLSGIFAVNLTDSQGVVLVSAQGSGVRPIAYLPDEREFDNIVSIDSVSEIAGVVHTAIDENGKVPPPSNDVDYNMRRRYEIEEKLEPKCQVVWHQYDPYNMFCFTKKKEQAVAGCVAIAGAQALTVLRPQMDMITSWDEVVKKYPSYNTTVQIAKLISFIGQSVNMDYGANKSGAKTEDLVPLFAKYGIRDYNAPHAIDVLKTKHGVIVVSAKRKKVDCLVIKFYHGGHAFLADGYVKYKYRDNPYYLHLNYGWGDSKKKGEYSYRKDAYILCTNKTWDDALVRKGEDWQEKYPYHIRFYSFTYEAEKNW